MKIEDNFIDQYVFNNLQKAFLDPSFHWGYLDGIESPALEEHIRQKQKDTFMLCHVFYTKNFELMINGKRSAAHWGEPTFPLSSPFGSMILLYPILKILDPVSIFRIKANLLTRTPSIVENTFHVDMPDLSEEKLKQWTTSIFYINTNNGYTEFEDGTQVESFANRMVTFPANLKHRGTSCTDEKTRTLINFDYFK